MYPSKNCIKIKKKQLKDKTTNKIKSEQQALITTKIQYVYFKGKQKVIVASGQKKNEQIDLHFIINTSTKIKRQKLKIH